MVVLRGTEHSRGCSGSLVKMTPKSILVVDDEPSVAETLALLLSIDRHRVEAVHDGKTAIARYNGGGGYDLVLTDFVMPGMDGLELAQLIKASTPQKPILLVTGHLGSVPKGKAGLPFIDGILAKPFSLQQLREAIEGVFPEG